MNFSYFIIFFQSFTVKALIYLVFLVFLKKGNESKSFFSLIFFLASISHPFVFLGIMNLPMSYLINNLLSQILIICLDTIFIYKIQKWDLKWAFGSAIVAQLFSWQFSPMLSFIIWS